MRVAMVSSYPPMRCGIGNYVHDLVQHLVRIRGLDLHVVTYAADEEVTVEQSNRIEVHRVIHRSRPNRDVRWCLDAIAPDVVHLQSSTFLHPLALYRFIHSGSRWGLTTTVHEVPSSLRLAYTFPALRNIYEFSDLLIVHSEHVASVLRDAHSVPEGRILRIQHGVDIEKYSPCVDPDPARRAFRLDEKRIVLFFGFLRPGKGLETLLHAWKSVSESFQDSVLVIAGDVPARPRRYMLLLESERAYGKKIRELAKSLALGKSVVFTDYVPSELVPSLFSSAELVVLPYEVRGAQSGPFHMALASGRAIVASSTPEFFSPVKESHSGLLFSPGNPRSLANEISTMLGSPELASMCGSNARRVAVERLSLVGAAEATAQAYERAQSASCSEDSPA